MALKISERKIVFRDSKFRKTNANKRLKFFLVALATALALFFSISLSGEKNLEEVIDDEMVWQEVKDLKIPDEKKEKVGCGN